MLTLSHFPLTFRQEVNNKGYSKNPHIHVMSMTPAFWQQADRNGSYIIDVC